MAAIIIIFFTLLNSLNFLVGMLLTPKNSVFLGTTHWPGDYFYYLSQFAQGKESWFGGYDLYTSDFPQKTFVGWVNVFAGRVFHLLGINQIWAYQISVVIFTALFLWLSYLLIKEIFPDRHSYNDPGSYKRRVVAFALFNFGNSWPTGADYWFNNGVPLTRLVGVPHQMLGKAMLVAALLLFIKWVKGDKSGSKYKVVSSKGILIGLIISGFILASVEPVHWGLVIMVLFFLALIRSYVVSFLHTTYYILPSLLLFLGGLPMLLYLKKLFSLPPYSQLAAWEASQQQYVGVWHFLLASGPVALLAILGILLFIRQLASQGETLQGWVRTNAVIFTVLTVGLFFSPIPAMISVVNVRFLPAVTTIFLATLATEAIYRLPKKRLILASVFALSLLPLPLQIQKRITFDKNNAYYYVPQSVMTAMSKAEKISTSADTILVIWPFNVPFPGITGRRVYAGHHLLTIDSAKKEELEWKFFDGQLSITQMRDFLKKSSINFIISYSWTKNLKELEGLEKVYDNGYLAVYKVRRGN